MRKGAKHYSIWRPAKSKNSPDGWVYLAPKYLTQEAAMEAAVRYVKLTRRECRIKKDDEWIMLIRTYQHKESGRWITEATYQHRESGRQITKTIGDHHGT